MIKFDCGRAPGLEKRVKRETDEADRTEAKVDGPGGGGAGVWPRLGCRCPSKSGKGEGGRAPAGKGFPARPSGSLRSVEGWHPSIVVSAPLQVTCSPRERPSHRPTPEFKIKTKSYRRESILNSSPNAGPKRTPEPPGSVEGQGVFPCRECERCYSCPHPLSPHPPPRQLPLSHLPPEPRSDLCHSGDSSGCSTKSRVEMPT